jgi:predicted secreted Zn-dependent protease
MQPSFGNLMDVSGLFIALAQGGAIGYDEPLVRPLDTFRRRLAMALFVLGVCGPHSVRAEVRLRESTEFFDIGFVDGNPDQLWKGLQRNGPFAHTGIIVGTTKSNASLTRTVQQTAKGCLLKSAEVNMTLLVTLPAWSWRNSAPPEHQAYWDCVERTVTIHENRHVEIWKETAHGIDTTLSELTVPMPCADLNGRVTEVFNLLMQEGRARQATFDADDRKRQRYEKCLPPTPAGQRSAASQQPAHAAGSAAENGPDIHKPKVATPLAVADLQDGPGLFDGPVGMIVAIILSAIALAAFGLAGLRHIAAKSAKGG